MAGRTFGVKVLSVYIGKKIKYVVFCFAYLVLLGAVPFFVHLSTMITVVTTVWFHTVLTFSVLLFCLGVHYDVFHADIFW